MTNEKKVYLVYPKELGEIAPELYGHFAEHIGGVIYDGIWVGKNSDVPNVNGFRKEIIDKLRAIKAPVIRWPGGCFAETYDWRDGIGKNRPTRLNWWGYEDGKTEPNTVGTHEFMDFCEAVGAKAYFAANLTSVSPLYIRNWMDYCLSPQGSTTLAKEREANGHPAPFDIPFWGVGNENWGGGGNMTPEHYADEFKRFYTLMKNAFPNVEYYMCGENGFDFGWTDRVIRNTNGHGDGFTAHYYCGTAGEAVDFSEDDWDALMKKASDMEALIERNVNIIHGSGAATKLVIDEWGCWHKGGSGPSHGENLFEQQSTVRDALVTAITLNIFNKHCRNIRMANVAQLTNNLHALFLAGGDKCIVTPTYHVFDMYKEHMGAASLECVVTDNSELSSSVSVSASVKNGKTLVTIGNLSCREDAVISLEGVGMPIPEKVEAEILSADDIHSHNTFENPNAVSPKPYTISADRFVLPRAGILKITF